MNLILDEKKYAEEVINGGLGNHTAKEALYILAKYYRFCGQSNKKITESLNNFMVKNYKNYNPVEWSMTIDYDVKNTKTKKLNQIEYIPVTKNELKTIKEIKGDDLQTLAFTLLCIAKFNNLVYPENHDWVYQNKGEIFKVAHLKQTEVNQDLMFNDLKTIGLIKLSKKINNTNLGLLYIDDDSEVVLKITDTRALGYEYLKYKGEKITCCQDCGVLMRVKTDLKRCTECNKVYRREYFRLRKQLEKIENS